MIYALALLFTTSLFTSCKKDGDDDVQDGGAYFSVMMDDDPFVAEDLYAFMQLTLIPISIFMALIH